MKYRVLRDGISQKEDGGLIVERKVGELIEVSDEAAPALVAEGFLGSSSRRVPVEEDAKPAKPAARRR